MLHAKHEELGTAIERRPRHGTYLALVAGDTHLTVFLTESQLDELHAVLTDAIAERVDCEECDGGRFIVDVIPKSETTPCEILYDPCETCDGRGWVLPETDDE